MQKTTVILLFLFYSLTAQIQVTADPDDIVSGLELSGTTRAGIGDAVQLGLFTIAGKFEARNEERYNNLFLPNHNWRGIGLLQVKKAVSDTSRLNLDIFVTIQLFRPHPAFPRRGKEKF